MKGFPVQLLVQTKAVLFKSPGTATRRVTACAAIVLLLSSYSPCATVVVDPAVTYQYFEGWGTSLCWWANLEGAYSAAYRDRVADVLMDPDSGLGYNIFRYNIGGGDQPGHNHMRTGGAIPGYKPTEAGAFDWTADPYQRNMVAAIAAKGLEKNQPIIWEAFSNSPPWWMTISGCTAGNTGGADNLKTDYFDDFAAYLTEVVRHFRDSWGITFRTVEPFNEPNAGWWTINNNQEGCGFKAGQPRMVKELGKSLTAAGLFPASKISAADENAVNQAVTGLAAYDDSSFSYMSQINTHTYYGRTAANFAALAAIAASRAKILWQSETGPLAGTGGQDITMLMSQYIIEDLRLLKASAWLDWQSYGSGDWGTFQVNRTTLALIPAKRYYMQAAFCRFIRPGSRFISSSDTNTIAALVPKTGNLVIIVRNGGAASVSYTFDLTRFTTMPASANLYQFLVSAYQTLSRLPDVSITGKQFTITSPARSVTTCLVAGVAPPVATLPRSAVRNDRRGGFAVSVRNGHALDLALPFAKPYLLTLYTSHGKKIGSLCGTGNSRSTTVDIGRFNLSSGLYIVQLQQGNDTKSGLANVVR